MLWEGTIDTLYMTFWSSLIAYVIGLPLGVLLVVTRKDGIMPCPTFNAVLGVVINFLRSIPFIIMLAVLFPVTRAVIGTAIGTKSIVFPLIISAFPYIARMVESSLDEVDHGIIEAAQSMGSTNWQIIYKVLLPEAVPSLVSGAAISKHLSVLKEADLIRDTREGKFIYYEMNASVLEEIMLWITSLKGEEA